MAVHATDRFVRVPRVYEYYINKYFIFFRISYPRIPQNFELSRTNLKYYFYCFSEYSRCVQLILHLLIVSVINKLVNESCIVNNVSSTFFHVLYCNVAFIIAVFGLGRDKLLFCFLGCLYFLLILF